MTKGDLPFALLGVQLPDGEVERGDGAGLGGRAVVDGAVVDGI